MKDFIESINSKIDAKGNRLKQKVEMELKAMDIPKRSTASTNNTNQSTDTSKVLYALAAVSFLTSIATDGGIRILSFLVGVGSLWGGYSQSKKEKPRTSEAMSEAEDIKWRSGITTQVVDIVKRISKDWNDFMEIRQQEVRNKLSTLMISEEERDDLRAKIYSREIIEFSPIEFTTALDQLENNAVFMDNFKLLIDEFMKKYCNAIDTAVNRQKSKYSQLI